MPPSGHTLPSLFVLLSAGLTAAAAMAEVLRLQKMRMMMCFHGSSDQQRHHSRPESENEDTGSIPSVYSNLTLEQIKGQHQSLNLCSLSRRQRRILGKGAAAPLSSPLSCSASCWFGIPTFQHFAAAELPVSQP